MTDKLLAYTGIKTKYLMRAKILIVFTLLVAGFAHAQSAGVRVGYVDMDYILANVDEYQQANKQLNTKVQRWKAEMDQMQSVIDAERSKLNTEKVLLTKELVTEREEEIQILVDELTAYQEKRFGPEGDLVNQQKLLVQPIQDQVFNAIQEVGKNRKFDFIFSKQSDMMMLYTNKKFDMSDIVLQFINRSEKVKERESKLDSFEDNFNPEKQARQKEIEEKKQAAEDLKAQRRKEYEERRQKLLEDREAKRQKMIEEREAKKKAAEEARQKAIEERNNKEENTEDKQ